MNWLIYIGGFPIFFYVCILLVTRLVGTKGSYEIKGINFYITVLSYLLVWIWICIKFIH